MSPPVHLDTSWLIRALVPGTQEGEQLVRWLASDTPLRMSTLAWAEFLCGPEPAGAGAPWSALAARVVRRRIPLSDDEAREAARLFSAGGRRRGSLADAVIAATAILDAAALATVDTRGFRAWEDAGLELT